MVAQVGACVDYIFTDPPFGENIYYADLNFLVESWHGVRTDSGPEATPALRTGASVVAVAQRLPERVVQEDADLLMYYDNALMRMEGR